MVTFLPSFLDDYLAKHYLIIILLTFCCSACPILFYQWKAEKILKDARIRDTIFSKSGQSTPVVTFQCILDSNNTITYISKNISIIIGYQANSIIRNKEISYLRIIHPEDRAQTILARYSTESKKINYQVEYRVQTKWGTEKWILEQGIHNFNRKGHLKSIQGILSDITQKKFTDDFLKESEKRFQVLIEKAPIGICIFCNDMITFVNKIYLQMFGIASDDILGSSILNFIAPDQRETIRQVLLKQNEKYYPKSCYETIGLKTDGTQFYMQLFLTSVNLGDFDATLGYFIDISAHKESEEKLLSLNQRLNDIIELIPDPTFVFDKFDKLLYWNKASEELTGVTKAEVIGKDNYSLSKILYGIHRPLLLDLIDAEDKEQEGYYTFVKRVNNKIYAEYSGQVVPNGKTTHLWGVAAPLNDRNGKRFGKIEVIKDISEAKNRELELQVSEKKARTLIDTNLDSILLVKTDGEIIDCNESFSQIFKTSRENLIGINIKTIFPEHYTQYRENMAGKAVEIGKVTVFESKSINGSDYYTTTIYPVPGKDQSVESLVIYAQNTTKLRVAENALRESEEHYKTITNSISDYVYKIVLEKNQLEFILENPGCENIFGYTIAEFKSNPNLFHEITLQDDLDKIMECLQIVKKQKSSKTIEHSMIHKNGTILWVSNTLIFYKEHSNNKIEINGVIKDISIRKQLEEVLKDAEERYRTIFDQSGLATGIFDVEGNLIMINSLAANILGGTTIDYIGKPLESFFPSDLAKGTRQLINKTLQNGSIQEEFELSHPSGSIWLKTTSHVIKNKTREIIGVQLVSHDITEKKELERRILNTIIETEEKERLHFAQELHDGLGPLISAIKIYVQWLSKPNAKISQKEILADTEQLINDATQTIREISFKLSPHILNNFGLMEAIHNYSEKLQHSKKIEIQILGNFTGRMEMIKETILYRVICECINNTLKHANGSIITIKIDKMDDKLNIIYTDNGQGFKVQQLTNNSKGNGLFNMQSRLQSINGLLVINSKPGYGTKILITAHL